MLAKQGTHLPPRILASAMDVLTIVATGRIVSSGAHSNAQTASKRSSTAAALQQSVSETLAPTVKLGTVGQGKERKEKEDVELKPPWDLLPYSRDPSVGNVDIPNQN